MTTRWRALTSALASSMMCLALASTPAAALGHEDDDVPPIPVVDSADEPATRSTPASHLYLAHVWMTQNFVGAYQPTDGGSRSHSWESATLFGQSVEPLYQREVPPAGNGRSDERRDDNVADEAGWTTYGTPTGDVYYVSSSEGSDSNDGLSPSTPFKTLDKAFERYKRGEAYHDHVMLKRGDTFKADRLNLSRYSGLSAEQPFVVATYGDSTQRPVIELSGNVTMLSGADEPASFRAFHGLDLYFPKADPNSPQFDQSHNSSGLSVIGLGEGLLFEDMRFRYGGLNIQGEAKTAPGHISDVTIRRSVIANAWSPQCGSGGHKQGSFLSNIHGLTLEENVYYHNGWNEVYGCATMFNHNVYAASVRDATFTNNAFLHSSSIGVKFSAFTAEETVGHIFPGTIEDLVFENNLIADSEVGVSAGGNGNGAYRFKDVVFRGNVFTELGADNSTGRNFQWGLQVMDHDNSLIEHNYFLDSPWNTNVHGISIGGIKEGASGKTNRDVTIRDNVFYDYTTNHIQVANVPGVSNVKVMNNVVVQGPAAGEVAGTRGCLVRTQGGGLPAGLSFSGNQYQANGSSWFCIDGARHDQAWWKANHESDASEFTGQMADPGRTLDDYATHLGYANKHELEQAMMENSRLTWDPKLTVEAINEYIKEGYRSD